MLRIGMALIIPWLALRPALEERLLAGAIFAIAAVTDYIDGHLARRNDEITTFGKILDPIADKLLVLGALATLSYLGMFPWWILLPILAREIIITVLRMYFLHKGVAVAAVKSGKQKTAMQITAIGFIYAYLLYQKHIITFSPAGLRLTLDMILRASMYIVLAIAVYLTLYSGYVFFRNNWGLMRRFHPQQRS